MIVYVIVRQTGKNLIEYWSEVGFTQNLYNAWFFDSEYSAMQYSKGGTWENCKIKKFEIKEIE